MNQALTARQVEIIKMVSTGRTTGQISIELGISRKAVTKHLQRARYKLDAHNIAHLMVLTYKDVWK